MKESEEQFRQDEIARYEALVKRTTEKLEALRAASQQENNDLKRNKSLKTKRGQSTSETNEAVPPVKLRISLQGLPHHCERILLVPEDISMRQLHFYIQRSMGWLNSHLFEFSNSRMRPKIRVGMLDDFDLEYEPARQDAHAVLLKETFLKTYEGKAFWYNYDFGDDWWHKLSLLKPTKKDLTHYYGFPVCLKAAGKCPPEDVGGSYGYAEFLEIVNDRKHPDYEDSRLWAGLDLYEAYDELQVNLEQINYKLMDFYMSAEYNLDQYDDI